MSTQSLIRRAWIEVAMAVAVLVAVVAGAQFFSSSYEQSKATALAENARLRGDAEAMRALRERTSRKYWAYLVTHAPADLAAATEAEQQFGELLARQSESAGDLAPTFERVRALDARHRALTARLATVARDSDAAFAAQAELQPIIEELDGLLAAVVATRRVHVEAARAQLISATQTGIIVFAVAAFAGLIVAGLLGFSLLRHIRAELRLRDQAARNERMAALGTLAAGVAHELKNPLSYVASNLGFVQELCAEGHVEESQRAELHEALLDARNGTERIQAIIADMWRFSRGDEATQTGADVRDAVEWAVRVARKQVEARARLRVEHGVVPPVRGNGTRIGQVVLNLLINAADAIAPGAAATNEVSVTTREVGGAVEIVVKDTGAGMDRDVAERIFEPFFTTKGPGKGTGLGLALSRTYVTDLGGELAVTSKRGEGSTFRVRVPVKGGSAEGRSPAEARG